MKISEYSGGIKIILDGLKFLIDPIEKFERIDSILISHAHFDHSRMLSYKLRTKAYLTPETLAIAKVRMKNIRTKVSPKGYGEKFEIYGKKFQFLPSGHVFGSSQILIENEGRIVYTGDFKLRDSLTHEGCKPLNCDVLIMDSIYGSPEYVFPDINEIAEEITGWVNNTLKDGFIPILTGNTFGQGQELTKMLSERFDVEVHPVVGKINRICEEFGVKLGSYEVSLEPSQGSVFIAPKWFLPYVNLNKCKIAFCSGRYLNGKHGGHKAFPLSNHADFNERIEYIKKVKPRLVITCHGELYVKFAEWIEQNLGIMAKPIIKEQKIKEQKTILDFVGIS